MAGQDGNSLEKQLLKSLAYSGLDKAHLADLVKQIVHFSDHGVRPVKVFPKGIPAPDGVEFHAHLDAKGLESLLQLIKSVESIRSVRVFPYGIPNPEIFRTEIGIG